MSKYFSQIRKNCHKGQVFTLEQFGGHQCQPCIRPRGIQTISYQKCQDLRQFKFFQTLCIAPNYLTDVLGCLRQLSPSQDSFDEMNRLCVLPGGRRGNNGVSRYPRYQKTFWLTENFNKDDRYFVVDIALMAEIQLFCCDNGFLRHLFRPKISHRSIKQYFFAIFYIKIIIFCHSA